MENQGRSYRQIQEFLSQIFKIEVARGTINRMRLEVSEAVEGATTSAKEWAQQQPAINCDETGFSQQNRDGKNPKDFKAWLWVLVTPLVSVFIVTLSRSQEVAKQLIGESFPGYLGSDRYGSYSWVKTELRQLCWSHLLRDFQAISERTGVSKEIGQALLAKGYRLFHWWHSLQRWNLIKRIICRSGRIAQSWFASRINVSGSPRNRL